MDETVTEKRWKALKHQVHGGQRTDWPRETYDHKTAMTDWLFRGELHDFPTWKEQVVEIVANSGFCV